MTNGVKGVNVLRAEAVYQTLSPSSHFDTDESLDGVQGVLFKGQSLPLGEPSENAKPARRLHF